MSQLDFIPFADIAESHLRDLIENKVPESLTLELKRAIVGTNDNEKREFLKDATALANTAGGFLVYGLAESDGVANELIPLDISSMDEEILRLQSILLNSVEPRLANVEMRGVPLAAGGNVLIVKIPQSWRPPHRVTHGNTNRFYLRQSNSVFQPDTERLRQVFNSSQDTEGRLEGFRDERIERLNTGQRGLTVSGSGKLLTQVVSLARGRPDYAMPPVQQCNLDFLPPITSNSTHRYNFDGLLLYAPGASENITSAYTQIFRDWKIEMARGRFVEQIEGYKLLRGNLLVVSTLYAVERSMKGMLKHGGIGPFAVLVTALDLAGTILQTMQGSYTHADVIDRGQLRFPMLILDGGGDKDKVQRDLLPIWDTLWQAYGYQNCTAARDCNGDWTGFPKGWIS